MIPQQSDLDRVFALQEKHYPALRNTTADQRIEKLRALENAILENRSKLEEAVYADLHKPVHETALTEIYMVTSEIKHACKHLHRWMRPVRVKNPLTFIGSKSEIHYQSRGVTLILAPWNYPFQLAIAPLVAAIAAGNCAIVKPSEVSVHTSQFVCDLISRTFAENEVACYEGDHHVASMLLRKPFHHIFFTGSPAIGTIVMQAAAQNHASVTLELGGKCPTLIDDRFPLDEAARKICWGKFVNAGQTCLAPDYVLIPHQRQEEFIQKMTRSISDFYQNPKSSPDYCKIVNSRHLLRMKNLMEDSIQKGARVITGGDFDQDSNYFAPTLLANVRQDSAILQEEIFGPLLPVVPYQSLEEAIAFMNARSRPLALYLFSRQDAFVELVLNQTDSGGVCINETVVHFGNASLPFGGINTSGMGNSHGYYGFRAFSHERSVLHQPRKGTITFLYPPYTDRVKKLVDWTIRFF